jgi:hypothetical protein
MKRLEAGLVLVLFAALGAGPAGEREGVRPEDRIDVLEIDRRLLAVRAGSGRAVVSVDLELGETVHAARSQGLVGVASTSSRLLGVTSESSRWHELRYRVRDRAGQVPGFEVRDRIAVAALSTRIAALAPGSTSWAELELGPGEGAPSLHADANIAVALTPRRAIAFSRRSGFVEVALDPKELPASVSLQESSATLRTARRVLIFRSSDVEWRDIQRRLLP